MATIHPPGFRPAIRKLWSTDQIAFRDHLLRLDAETRHHRFAGGVSDDFLRAHAAKAFRDEVVIYGAFIDGTLRAAAELRHAKNPSPEAEAAFSVEKDFQDHGLGTSLMDRILTGAQNRSIRRLHIICLRENGRMRHLAEKYEARFRLEEGEVSGILLPGHPTAASVFEEWIDDTRGLASAILKPLNA